MGRQWAGTRPVGSRSWVALCVLGIGVVLRAHGHGHVVPLAHCKASVTAPPHTSSSLCTCLPAHLVIVPGRESGEDGGRRAELSSVVRVDRDGAVQFIDAVDPARRRKAKACGGSLVSSRPIHRPPLDWIERYVHENQRGEGWGGAEERTRRRWGGRPCGGGRRLGLSRRPRLCPVSAPTYRSEPPDSGPSDWAAANHGKAVAAGTGRGAGIAP